jgi:hypothetical protein
MNDTTWLLSAKDWYLKNKHITKETYQSVDRGKYSATGMDGYRKYQEAKQAFYKLTFPYANDYIDYCIKQSTKEIKNHKNGTVIHKALEWLIDDYIDTQEKIRLL